MTKKHRKTLLVAFACIFASATASLLTLTACGGSESYTYQKSTVFRADSNFISPSALSLGGDGTFVSDATANKVYKLSKSGEVEKSYSFDDAVNGVLVNGDDVYVLVGGLAGEVYRLDASLNLIAKVNAGHTPIAATVHGGKLYVANRFSNSVSVYKTDLSEPTEIKIDGKEPFDIASAQDKVFVACRLNGGAANEDIVAANIAIIDPASGSVKNTVKLLNGTSNVNSITASSDGSKLYLANTFARYTYPTSQLDRGWVNTNGITVFDVENEEVVAGVLLDGVDNGAANPWGIDVIGDGESAVIACAISGLSQIAVVNEKAMLDKIAASQNAEDIVNRADFLGDTVYRITVGGKGVRDIELAQIGGENYAYVTQYFDGAVCRVSLTADEPDAYEIKQYKLGEQGKMTQERMGEILWQDATICYQGWESCSSCHPDARSDGLNWDELGDGIGTPKQTKSMMYAHRTPPVLVTGVVDRAETNVAETVMYAFHNDIGEKYYECMDAYLRSLKPVQSPYLNRDGSLTESALRGKALFNEYSCNTCHSTANYTDLTKHRTGTVDSDDNNSWENRPLDTPTLVEIWRTAPYGFHGGMVTMEEAVEFFIKEGGRTASAEQIKDLANYVLSIGDNNEIYGVQSVTFKDNDTEEAVITTLKPNTTITKITVRKQWEVDKKAFVKLALYSSNGEQVGEAVYAVLTDMHRGDYAVIDCNIKLPSSMGAGSYYEITISNPDDSDEALATAFKVYMGKGE